MAANTRIEIYKVTSFNQDIDLNFLTNYVNGWLINLSDCVNSTYNNKSGRAVKKQEVFIITDSITARSVGHYCKVQRWNFYTPSSKRGDKTHELYVSLGCMLDHLKTKEEKGGLLSVQEYVYGDIVRQMQVFIESGIVQDTDFEVAVYVRKEPEFRAFAFINFKEHLPPWVVGIVCAGLRQKVWTIGPVGYNMMDVRTNKVNVRSQETKKAVKPQKTAKKQDV